MPSATAAAERVLQRFHERGEVVTKVEDILQLLRDEQVIVSHDDLHEACRRSVGFSGASLALLQSEDLVAIVHEVVAIAKSKHRSQRAMLAEVYAALEDDDDEEEARAVSIDDIAFEAYESPARSGLQRVLDDYGLSHQVLGTLPQTAAPTPADGSLNPIPIKSPLTAFANSTVGFATPARAPSPPSVLTFDRFHEWYATLRSQEGQELGLLTPSTTPPDTPKPVPLAPGMPRGMTKRASKLRKRPSLIPRVASLAARKSFVGAAPAEANADLLGASALHMHALPPRGSASLTPMGGVLGLLGANALDASHSYLAMPQRLTSTGTSVDVQLHMYRDGGKGGDPGKHHHHPPSRAQHRVPLLNNNWPARREAGAFGVVDAQEVVEVAAAAALALVCCSFPVTGYFFWMADQKTARTRALMSLTADKAKKEARLRVAIAAARRGTPSFGLADAASIAAAVTSPPEDAALLTPSAKRELRKLGRQLQGTKPGGAGKGKAHAITAIKERIRTAQAMEAYGVLDDPDDDAVLKDDAAAAARAGDDGSSADGGRDETCTGEAEDGLAPSRRHGADLSGDGSDSTTRSFEGHLDAGFHEAARTWGKHKGSLDGARLRTARPEVAAAAKARRRKRQAKRDAAAGRSTLRTPGTAESKRTSIDWGRAPGAREDSSDSGAAESSSEDDLVDDLLLAVEHVVSHRVCRKVAEAGAAGDAASEAPGDATLGLFGTPSVNAKGTRVSTPRKTASMPAAPASRPWGFGGKVNYMSSAGKRGTPTNPAPDVPGWGRKTSTLRAAAKAARRSWVAPPALPVRGKGKHWEATEGTLRVELAKKLTDLVAAKVEKLYTQVKPTDEYLRKATLTGNEPEAHHDQPLYARMLQADAEQRWKARRKKRTERKAVRHAVTAAQLCRPVDGAKRRHRPPRVDLFGAGERGAEPPPRPGTAPPARRCTDPRCASRSPPRTHSPPSASLAGTQSSLRLSPQLSATPPRSPGGDPMRRTARAKVRYSPPTVVLPDADDLAPDWGAADGATRAAVAAAAHDIALGIAVHPDKDDGSPSKSHGQAGGSVDEESEGSGESELCGVSMRRDMYRKSFGAAAYEDVPEVPIPAMSFAHMDQETPLLDTIQTHGDHTGSPPVSQPGSVEPLGAVSPPALPATPRQSEVSHLIPRTEDDLSCVSPAAPSRRGTGALRAGCRHI
eukprot:TRINITY_DN7219_c0_g2_i1.p1 TRINITY_DN7219_c0_g2~~TRINITY_DN7219_c0_g2_i1.p1  ORF type:complete len:1190 (+),score=350.41 TRINITY_DN7219_c0_g2_i1:151-3720(+)